MSIEELLDIQWIVICTALVLVMQGGFLCLETGVTRSKNSINVALKNAMDLAVAVLVFWGVGYGLMFGASASGWIGTSDFAFEDMADPFLITFFLFQSMFAATMVTIVSGAVAERLRFIWYLIISAVLAGLVYPLFGHWAWNGLAGDAPGGWLGIAGFVDWAGSTVVHAAGGWAALALLLIIGPRAGRFQDGNTEEVAGSNYPMVALGAVMLWFGWIGFNAGSTLSLTPDIGPIMVKTSMAAAGGAMTALLIGWALYGRAGFLPSLNGLLAGLVAITACAHAVSFSEAVLIGAIGGLLSKIANRALLQARIDDAVGAVPVHLVPGIWGTLAVALFGDPEVLGTGLSVSGQLFAQLQGVLACAAVAFFIPLIVFGAVNKFWRLRVGPEDEKIGLNVTEHGARTELFDFVDALTTQAREGDLSLRVPEDPFTEIGQIGRHYNKTMASLQEVVSRTDAIVRGANDAILMLDAKTGAVRFHNPVACDLFGYEASVMEQLPFTALMPDFDPAKIKLNEPSEATARRITGDLVPVEVSFSSSDTGGSPLLITIVRDVTERKRAQDALLASEARFRAVYEHAAFGMVVVNRGGTILDANAALGDMLEAPVKEIRELAFSDILHEEDMGPITAGLELLYSGADDTVEHEVRLRGPDGPIVWVLLSLTLAPDSSGATPLVIAMAQDMTMARRQKAALNLAASVFESTQESIIIFNTAGEVERINRAYAQASEYEEREVRGLDFPHIVSARYGQEFFDSIERILLLEGAWQGEVMIRRKSGELVPTWLSLSLVKRDDGSIANRIGIFADLTERKEKEESIWRHANYDSVTGLPNRRLFMDRLGHALTKMERGETKVAVFFLDLDRFKQINDTQGHAIGDRLLQEVGGRLSTAVRRTDTVARLGGDEFTIIIEDYKDDQALSQIANTVLSAFAEPFLPETKKIKISTSIGIGIAPEDGRTASDLLRSADSALYYAKELGRNNYQFFTSELKQRLTRQIEVEAAIRKGLEEDEFLLYYQPQIDSITGAVTGLEALLRWRRADGRIDTPGSFIEIAEESGLIVPLGDRVVHMLARDMSVWRDQGFLPSKVSFNAAAKQFAQRHPLTETVLAAFDGSGIDMHRVCVEVTETDLMLNHDIMTEQLAQLNEMGVTVALDDFGTGYSSLSRLKRLPVQSLKLDKAFIDGLPENEEDVAMATAIVNMAGGLDIDLIAEGVEREEQIGCLRNLGCHYIQGFYYSKPLAPNDVLAFANERIELAG